MSVQQIHTTIAVLMHFVITLTDPSIAHVNLDLQGMEKTAQVVFSVVRVFSYGSRNFISNLFLSLNFLLIAMQRQGWMQGRWFGRLATSPFLADLLVCQNSSIGTLFQCYARYRVQLGREQVFCKCNQFYILWRCMNLRCCRFLFVLTQLKRFRDAIYQDKLPLSPTPSYLLKSWIRPTERTPSGR